MTQIAPTSVDGDGIGEGDDVARSDDNADPGDDHFVRVSSLANVLVCVSVSARINCIVTRSVGAEVEYTESQAKWGR